MHVVALTWLLAAGGMTVHMEPAWLYDDAPVDFTLVADGGVPPYSFALENHLPDGLTFDRQGHILGTPMQYDCGPQAPLKPRFRVTDATGASVEADLAIDIRCRPLILLPESLQETRLIQVQGGLEPVVLTITGLPSGLSAVAAPPRSAEIVGHADGDCAAVTASAVDARHATGERTWLVCADVTQFAIAPSELPDGTIGQPYSVQLSTGWPTTFSLQAGDLPPDIAFDDSGLLQGTPASGGMFDFSISATSGGLVTTRDYELRVSEQPSASPSHGSTSEPHPHTMPCSASSGPATLAPLGLLLFLRRRRRSLAP